MSDIIEQGHSIESPPASSLDTLIASANLPDIDLGRTVDADGIPIDLVTAGTIANFSSNGEDTRQFFQDDPLMDEDWDTEDLEELVPPWDDDFIDEA